MAPNQKPKGTFAKLMSSTTPPPPHIVAKENTEQKELEPPQETMIPRHHDTLASRNHDTTIPVPQEDIFEVVRKAVKQVGKEAATHRFTVDEKNLLAEIEYTYKRKGIRTSENEITRIAINYFIEDYRQHGEKSILSQALKRLNS